MWTKHTQTYCIPNRNVRNLNGFFFLFNVIIYNLRLNAMQQATFEGLTDISYKNKKNKSFKAKTKQNNKQKNMIKTANDKYITVGCLWA